MSNYEFAVATKDIFKVKNPKEVVDVFQTLGFEETYESNGEIFIGGYEQPLGDELIVYVSKETGKAVAIDKGFEEIISIDNGEEVEDLEEFEDEDKYECLDCFEYLQRQLLDRQIASIVESGNEKLRFVGACLVVISKDRIVWKNTNGIINEVIERIRENKGE